MSRLLLLAALPLAACGLTVTNERPEYSELDTAEQRAVDIIYGELAALDKNVRASSAHSIAPLVDKERINVSFESAIFIYNLGDGVMHVSVWENLTDAQRELVQSWFQRSTPAEAKEWYEWFFYRFLAVAEGVKQFAYNVHGSEWMLTHRSVYSLQRDAMRTGLAHFKLAGRQGEVWSRTANTCAPVIKQYDSQWGYLFLPAYAADHYKKAKEYLQDNYASMVDPADPTGYLYWICQGIAYEKTRLDPLTVELEWLRTLGSGTAD